MDVFPAFVPLIGRRVGLTGSGEGLAARRRLLSGSPAQIIDLALSEAADPRSWAGMALGFVADADLAACAAAAAAARAAGVPVNVMDRPALCDFTVPAIIDRGAVVAALGTGGASPLLVSRLRAEIETRLPPGLGRLATYLEARKDVLRARFPDPADRRVFLSGLLDGELPQALEAGGEAAADATLFPALESGAAPPGRLFSLPADTPADLVSLKACRVLAGVDLLVLAEGADTELATLARRDAVRATPAEAPPGLVAQRLGEGRTVVLACDPAPYREAGLLVSPLPVAR